MFSLTVSYDYIISTSEKSLPAFCRNVYMEKFNLDFEEMIKVFYFILFLAQGGLFN
jgi:hypothetical protein